MSAPFVNRTANVQRDEYVGGFGMGGGCDWDVPTTEDNYQSFVVVDEVRVPKVEPGEYILSWRWDVEQGNVRLPSLLRLCLLVSFYWLNARAAAPANLVLVLRRPHRRVTAEAGAVVYKPWHVVHIPARHPKRTHVPFSDHNKLAP